MTKTFKEFSSKRHKEGFYKGAKKYDLRARSYFKLEQIDKKFSLVKEGDSIIDLGCAPGGWLQYLDNKVDTAKIIGIDLLEIKRPQEFSENVEIIEDDFNDIKNYIKQDFDLVISDMAPEFSGDSKVDRGRTHKLNLDVLDFCSNHLKKGGNALFKTFGGEDLAFVRRIAKKQFEEIKEFKPNSSQKKSAELFIVCLNKQ